MNFTQEQAESCTITRAVNTNSQWRIIVQDDNKIFYPVFFQGDQSMSDYTIKDKTVAALLLMEKKEKTDSVPLPMSQPRKTLINQDLKNK
jgi:hypothetical protein